MHMFYKITHIKQTNDTKSTVCNWHAMDLRTYYSRWGSITIYFNYACMLTANFVSFVWHLLLFLRPCKESDIFVDLHDYQGIGVLGMIFWCHLWGHLRPQVVWTYFFPQPSSFDDWHPHAILHCFVIYYQKAWTAHYWWKPFWQESLLHIGVVVYHL